MNHFLLFILFFHIHAAPVFSCVKASAVQPIVVRYAPQAGAPEIGWIPPEATVRTWRQRDGWLYVMGDGTDASYRQARMTGWVDSAGLEPAPCYEAGR